jgi:hypothetical protein
MTTRRNLLTDLLRALVREWGQHEVEAALASLAHSSVSDRHLIADDRKREQRARRAKPLASQQVARTQIPEAQKIALLELAIRFDRKQFLPSVSSVREFLLMIGERPSAIRDRSDAIRPVFEALSRLSPDHLEKIASSTIHSGPSQLGPISDAISAAAASLPRYRKSDPS